MYLFGEEMSTCRLERELRRAAFSQTRIFRRAGYFLQRRRAGSPMWSCPRVRAWKKKARSPAPKGASSGSIRFSSRSKAAAGLADRSGGRESAGRRWNYGTLRNHGRDRRAHAAVRRRKSYERLEGYKSLQWPVAADGTDEPLLYTKRFNFPDGKARLFPVTWRDPTEQPDAEYDLHAEQRPAARAFP
jgi:anaerobic selenocysteine-containing dehydrogenase